MTAREKKLKSILDQLYPGLVIRELSSETLSEGLKLNAEEAPSASTGIPLLDYYHEAECLLSNGYATGELYDNGISYEFLAWMEKNDELHLEWENTAIANLYIVDDE
jgi:hypothetical protein